MAKKNIYIFFLRLFHCISEFQKQRFCHFCPKCNIIDLTARVVVPMVVRRQFVKKKISRCGWTFKSKPSSCLCGFTDWLSRRWGPNKAGRSLRRRKWTSCQDRKWELLPLANEMARRIFAKRTWSVSVNDFLFPTFFFITWIGRRHP